MEPISVGLLAALAGGVGGEAGRQAWAGLSALVRRPFQRGRGIAQAAVVGSGEAELTALGQEPTDAVHAQALSAALALRAAADAEFHAALQQWHTQAQLARTGEGDVHNTISGGTQHGPVLQGRDFSGISLITPPPPATPGDCTSPPQS
ncbi:hypothetical protein G3M58_37215 [Streptomyces sp. SID7499]|uniref:Uncharacterized protein n=1 Tax=Streptomyces sp. SID7499 TaxID=2706086 RepID=A0A6G3X320_9ACTN|nr:hypothetical protein [Streptomyces sp. SID7499]